MRLRLIDPANPTRRGTPAGVRGAAVFSYIGATPPTSLSDWKFEGNVTRKGMPKPLHLALFVRRFAREVRAPFPPAWAVRMLMAPLAALAHRRGHGERYATA